MEKALAIWTIIRIANAFFGKKGTYKPNKRINDG